MSPAWLTELPVDEVRELQLARIRREVGDFAGLIDAWDVVNEAGDHAGLQAERNGITRLAQEVGRVELIRMMFEAARATNPGATLLLNDFDLSADYERVIEESLEAGVRIDAIGIQSHMHQGWWGVERTQEVLERFARFGLPLHLTETTLVSGDRCRPTSSISTTTRSTLAVDTRGRGSPGRRDREPLPDARRAPGGRVDHVVGHPGRGWLEHRQG